MIEVRNHDEQTSTKQQPLLAPRKVSRCTCHFLTIEKINALLEWKSIIFIAFSQNDLVPNWRTTNSRSEKLVFLATEILKAYLCHMTEPTMFHCLKIPHTWPTKKSLWSWFTYRVIGFARHELITQALVKFYYMLTIWKSLFEFLAVIVNGYCTQAFVFSGS